MESHSGLTCRIIPEAAQGRKVLPGLLDLLDCRVQSDQQDRRELREILVRKETRAFKEQQVLPVRKEFRESRVSKEIPDPPDRQELQDLRVLQEIRVPPVLQVPRVQRVQNGHRPPGLRT